MRIVRGCGTGASIETNLYGRLYAPPVAAVPLILVFALGSPGTHAQYPEKTITVVVPFPPGGVADTVARPVAEAMSRELKQSVVIENKSGAGGAVGMGHAARAAPDGYTLLLSCLRSRSCPRPTRCSTASPRSRSTSSSRSRASR